jgi:REP element-mobilizing transposase RayT
MEVVKMPRRARQKSESGIYHIILRGINRQIIFEDEEDNNKLLELLKRYKEVCEYKLYAYCFMGNHIHLMIKVEKEGIDKVIKRVGGSYVYWYNKKYNRSGHLFQDRFRSEVVENDRYFLTVLRYIHQNPVKAGLCKCVADYKYSSYSDFINRDSGLMETEYVFSIIDKKMFIELNDERNNDSCMELEEKVARINDSDAMVTIQNVSGCSNTTEFQALDENRRNQYIRELKKNSLSARQISRLTGISYGIIRKY